MRYNSSNPKIYILERNQDSKISLNGEKFSPLYQIIVLKFTATVTTVIDSLYPLVINHTNTLRFASKFIGETKIEYLSINRQIFLHHCYKQKSYPFYHNFLMVFSA